jgi:hypothetical protein
MYTTRAQKFDEEDVENWKGGADGILVFVCISFPCAPTLFTYSLFAFQTGLFSSTVATFIAISYQNLQQDPNLTTQSLLAQISQQLSNSTTGSTSSTATPFVPPASAVFINSVWFLSLVLSLTCALMATLLQQWARRYFQMIQRHNAPHVRAHIREYFAQGARRFRISALVEVLPSLLLLSVLLFFAGLVVFAFSTNNIVAYSTLAIVASFFLSYIAFTLMPLIHHDCPYQTPLTAPLWSCTQTVSFFLLTIAHYGAKEFYKLSTLRGVVTANTVKSFHDKRSSKVKSLSEGMMCTLENSAKCFSMDTYRSALRWMLDRLVDDLELEEFIAEIPELYNSEALVPRNGNNDPQNTIHAVLAVLPGPTSFDAPLPWSIIQLAQRAITSGIQESTRRRRTRASLRALYHIPGAIRDLLAPYASSELYCLAILPLLNSPESLEVINELWDTHNDDVSLSVRCTAAVIADFMISPPLRTLDYFLAPHVPFIGDGQEGKRFLLKRLCNDNAAPTYDLNSDDARRKNCTAFALDTIGWENLHMSEHSPPIEQQRGELSDARHCPGYRVGRGTFDQHGDRGSPAFVPAAQLDLFALTTEILTRHQVPTNATPSLREAFDGASAVTIDMEQAEETPQFLEQFMPQSMAESLESSLSPSRLPSPTSLRSPSVTSLLAPSRSQLLPPRLAQSLAQNLIRWLAPSLESPRSLQLAESLALLLAPSLSPALLQSLAPSRSQSLTQWLAQLLNRTLEPSRSQSLPQWLAQLLVPSLAPLQSQWLAQSLAQLPAPSQAQSLAQSQALQFEQSLAQFVAGIMALSLAVLRVAWREESPIQSQAVSLVHSLSQLLTTLLGELLEQLSAPSPTQIQNMRQSLERAQAQVVDTIEMVARTLQRGPEGLRLLLNDAQTSPDRPFYLSTTPQAISEATAVDADRALILVPVRSTQRPTPLRSESAPSRLHSFVSPSPVGGSTTSSDGGSNSPTEPI